MLLHLTICRLIVMSASAFLPMALTSVLSLRGVELLLNSFAKRSSDGISGYFGPFHVPFTSQGLKAGWRPRARSLRGWPPGEPMSLASSMLATEAQLIANAVFCHEYLQAPSAIS